MEEKPHKRRVRYRGTHPTKFEEKYKELQPEKYAATVEKVIQKGGTPAGMHRSIMVAEVLQVLRIRPGEQGLDATLGYGGHTKAMLEQLSGKGCLYACDVDSEEAAKTTARLRSQGFGEDLLKVRLQNFSTLGQLAAEVGGFDFILADLGVSSMQIDNPARGFSFKTEGPLDLRMDPKHGEPAYVRLAALSKEELAGCFLDNADEPYAEAIAAELVRRRRKGQRIETTTALREAVETAVLSQREVAALAEREQAEAVKKSCARVFQALRIDVNHEYEALYAFLEALPDALRPGGRAALLTFHSGEDRLVKKAFKEGKRAGVYQEISEDVIRPSAEECFHNSRARSTKLRYAVKAE